MRTKQEYINSLLKLKGNIYFRGEKISRDHEELEQSINVLGHTFDAAANPESAGLCTAKSHISGETINRFCHIHQSTDDLHKKQDMTRMLCRHVGYCIGRCMGCDSINAVNAVSFEADKLNNGNTEYHKNFLKWLDNFQKNDFIAACAQTDVKGERMLRPSQQPDPDHYLRVVEKRSDGIVVRGCKVHITQAAVADEIMVVPTRSLGPDEKDYAVAFAVPADYDGVKQIVHPHNMRQRQHFKRGFDFGAVDSYVIFDDVFVPWDRVFLCGEHQHGGLCALLFALFHRHSYSGCKPAIGDITLGLAALAAEVNGVEKSSHIREKLANIIQITELGYAAGYTASEMGKPEVYIPGFGRVPYGPGSYIPNSIYCNVGRCLTGEAVFHEQEILCDIAGGVPATFPFEQDLTNEELKPYVEKYMKRNSKIPVEDQIKFWLYFSDMTVSNIGACMSYASFHGGGSPIMEQIAITTQYDIKERKNIVKKLAGISEKTE
ncbi:MAG TPA: 4-hydroxyphenylacetate 3-hydroxylase N-terminal domain-containing protein [Spirochaetota bacterium]|mgnify:CR=1 FL=1|nr:4-hydroxyphenylacetate 3-hydroxylase N-terminal domain-containing protein [Spirochaetota bacterium]HPI90524.1 4-hydroxyphenylacetate 3-hydroxylase N-terminal domain-containing protein [Spirochaetota bacterium]HPR47876.1 4-hydroxyphenylacetate 3-hydroxylase N-terminal domain-containing protein [Spirochaetota bacterium]